MDAVEIERAIRPAERTAGEQMLVDTKPEPLDAMIMEYVPNGDLATFLKEVGSQHERIPNAVLWRFFLCRES